MSGTCHECQGLSGISKTCQEYQGPVRDVRDLSGMSKTWLQLSGPFVLLVKGFIMVMVTLIGNVITFNKI